MQRKKTAFWIAILAACSACTDEGSPARERSSTGAQADGSEDSRGSIDAGEFVDATAASGSDGGARGPARKMDAGVSSSDADAMSPDPEGGGRTPDSPPGTPSADGGPRSDADTGNPGAEVGDATVAGFAAGTTSARDFHSEDLLPADPGFSYGGYRFPRSIAVEATFAEPAELIPQETADASAPPLASARINLPYEFVEICATPQADAAVKLWLYRTKVESHRQCDNFRCHMPLEVEETPLGEPGEAVCSIGRAPRAGEYYVVVQGEQGSPVQVTTRPVEAHHPPSTTAPPFRECRGDELDEDHLPDVGFGSNSDRAELGDYEIAGRLRDCSRFRGCTPWQTYAVDTVELVGECDRCQPPSWSDPAGPGTVAIHRVNFSSDEYEIRLSPTVPEPDDWTSFVRCTRRARGWRCGAAGQWTVVLDPGVPRATFERDPVAARFVSERSELTTNCLRVVAESLREEWDRPSDPRDTVDSDSMYREYELVLRSELELLD